MNFTTTYKQAKCTNRKKIHDILWLSRLTQKKTNPYPLKDDQLNIFRAFNLDVQYPHAIDTSMTIHIEGGTKYLE